MRLPVSENKIAALEARIGSLSDGKAWRVTPEQDLIMSRYVACLRKRIPIPRLLRKQVKKLCQDPPGPPSAALQRMYDDVMSSGDGPEKQKKAGSAGGKETNRESN